MKNFQEIPLKLYAPVIMDPRSSNEDYAQKLLNGRQIPQTPDLSNVQRMTGAPSKQQQPPCKMPRNLGLQAWEKFDAAAAITPGTIVENNQTVVVGAGPESVGGQEDCGEYVQA